MSDNFGQSIVNTLVGELATIRNQQRRSWPPTIRQQQQLSDAAGHQINNNVGIELANGAREDVLKDVVERIETVAKVEFNRRFDQFLADKRKSDTQRNNEQRAMRRQEAYKTEMCKRFLRDGQCQYGEQCRFAHIPGELRARQLHQNYKTKLCRNFSRTGFCYYGHRCQFLHRTPPNSPLEHRRPLALSAITFNNGVGGAMNGPMFVPQHHPMPMPITSNPQYGSAFTGHPFTGPYMIFSPPAYVDQNGFGIPNALFTASTPIGNTQFPFPPPEEFLRR